MIKNNVNFDAGGGITYSLDEEVFTGDYWVDGKPIYQKTIQRTSNVVNTTLTFDTGISQDSYVTDYVCRMELSTGTVVINSSGNYDIGSWITSDNRLSVYSRTSRVNGFIATIYYTK